MAIVFPFLTWVFCLTVENTACSKYIGRVLKTKKQQHLSLGKEDAGDVIGQN